MNILSSYRNQTYPTVENSMIYNGIIPFQAAENASLFPPWCSWRGRHLHKVVELKISEDLQSWVSRIIPEEDAISKRFWLSSFVLDNWAFLSGEDYLHSDLKMSLQWVFLSQHKVRPAKLAHIRQRARNMPETVPQEKKRDASPPSFSTMFTSNLYFSFVREKVHKNYLLLSEFLCIVDWWLHWHARSDKSQQLLHCQKKKKWSLVWKIPRIALALEIPGRFRWNVGPVSMTTTAVGRRAHQ